MTKQELQTRIEKKEEQIKKIEKRITKWEDAKCEKEFLKKDGWLLNLGRDRNYLYEEYLKECDNEVRYAKRDLEEAILTLKKYQNMLQVELAKENELENNKIDVIWNFLLDYKERVKNYIRSNLKWLERYYELNSQYCELHNSQWRLMSEGKSKEEIKEQLKELDRLEKEAKENIHPYTSMVARKNYETKERYIDEEKLEEILLKDITQRYFQLINQITKYVGKIQDASYLRIGAKGDLNGVVIGEEGKAKVETIGAGGYNIQCFHYRTLINKVSA